MHQSALRLRLRYQPRLHCYSCNIHVRHLSSPGGVPVASSDHKAIETLEPWQDSGEFELARKERDSEDIIVDNLAATLEAHRASNRAFVVRNVDATGVERPFKGVVPEKGSDRGKKVDETTQGEKKYKTRHLWPADSVQAREEHREAARKWFVKRDDPFEYNGTLQWPKEPWRIVTSYMEMQMQRPWLAYLETTSEDNLGRLTDEIKAYEAYMRLTPQEDAASHFVISDVNSVTRNERITLLGSRSTGLATPISDFDFSITLPNSLPGGWILPDDEKNIFQLQLSENDNKNKAVKVLSKIERHFHSSSKFRNTEFVRHARVPIIRSTHVATGLEVQIQTMAQYRAAHEHTLAYLSEFPSLRPLYIILRYCLELRDLTTVFRGGLGSYSLLMMIVTAMKHANGKFATDDLGGQLIHVLEFYGGADLYKVGFSANPPRVFEKQKEGWSLKERMNRLTDAQLIGIDQMQKFHPKKPYLLCLQDPANPYNDLGKNAYAIKHIQATFNALKENLQTALEERNKGSDDSAKGKRFFFLEPLVKADYRAFELHRSRIERCASSRKPGDQDYSNERIRTEFERRVNQYKGVEKETDDLSNPAVDAIDGNAAESVRAEESLGEGTILAWYRKELARSHAQSDEAEPNAKKKKKMEKLQGTNDEEYGWVPSSPNDQSTLLEAKAAPKSALTARTKSPLVRKQRSPPVRKQRSPSVHKHHSKPLRKPGERKITFLPPTTTAISPQSVPLPLTQKLEAKAKPLARTTTTITKPTRTTTISSTTTTAKPTITTIKPSATTPKPTTKTRELVSTRTRAAARHGALKEHLSAQMRAVAKHKVAEEHIEPAKKQQVRVLKPPRRPPPTQGKTPAAVVAMLPPGSDLVQRLASDTAILPPERLGERMEERDGEDFGFGCGSGNGSRERGLGRRGRSSRLG